MKLIIVLFLYGLMPVMSNAQTESAAVQRYIYEVKFQIDSTDADKVATENFFLDVAVDKGSRFASEGKLIKDSVVRYWEAQLAAGAKSVNIKKTISSLFSFVVVKDANGKMTYRDNAGDSYFFYKEDYTKILWKILPGFEDYHGIKTQKAVANYGGRIWNVLFTNEIPLIDGPYKFKNLPGFVVKAWDSRNHYTFSFVESKNLTTPFDIRLSAKNKEVTKEQLYKAIENYRSKPLFGGVTITSGNDAWKAEREKAQREKLKRENNLIELKD